MPKQPTKQYDFNLTPRQIEAYKLLSDPTQSCAVMYGGAKGGGKSWLFCVWTMGWLEYLVKFFELKRTKKPPLVGFMGRKQGTDFTHTTLETWKRVIPPELYRIKEQAKEIIWRETIKIWFGGLDDSATINKFNSAELAFIALDQAEETERTDVEVMQASLRFKIGDKTPPYKELYTANPADCWLKEEFIDDNTTTQGRNLHYVPALPSDNPHLPAEYCDRLAQVFRHSKPLLKAYLYGDWHALQASNAMFSSNMLSNLKLATFHWKDTRCGVVCDPSLGGDECVIYVMRNYKIVEEKIIVGERDTMKVAGEMIVLAQKWRTRHFAIDSIGIGAGIADRLRELNSHNNVIYINSAEKASDELGFKNKRAEMWWYAMEMTLEKKLAYPEDEELRKQLCAPRFKVVNSNGKRQLEPKDEVKKRIGRSPDRGDCWVYGVWATQMWNPVRESDAWENSSSHRGNIIRAARSAMAV